MGLPALRDALAEDLRRKGHPVHAVDVLVTGGAQQGLNVIARALIEPGDAVLCESPTWHGAFRAFRAAGAEVHGVASGREGLDPDALEDALLRRRPKFVYMIPSYQCPTGRLMSLERRRRLLALCARLRTPIVESHVYGELAFDDGPPSLKALDEYGIVIHQGSASKSITAALRLGWLAAPAPVLETLAAVKSALDLSTPALPQAVLAEFIAGGEYARHLPRLRALLRARRDSMLAALREHCADLRCTVPSGGLYLWVRLPASVPSRELETAAGYAGVVVRSGDAFLPNGGGSGHLRLCYAAPPQRDIAAGIERLGQALRAVMRRRNKVDESGAGPAGWASV
jgi:DNA-binding transcriptional MocR family regulator